MNQPSNTPAQLLDPGHGRSATQGFPAAPAHPRVLSIAGSDPSGGAGIQADLKAIAAFAGYGMAAITALTAQNTHGVRAVHVPDTAFLRAQLEAISEDITIDALKIGMLGTAEVIDTVGEWLAQNRPPVVVLDPVMVATSGDVLLDHAAREALLGLLRHVDMVTPNLPELAVLLDEAEARDWESALLQGKALASLGQFHVLVKGGHLDGPDCPDALIGPDGTVTEFPAVRLSSPNTHGTGCSLSAALATEQARTGDWRQSVDTVKTWLQGAIAASGVLDVGTGHGPVNHFHALWAGRPPTEGAFAASLWRDCEPVLAAILALPFIRDLAAGTLLEADFGYYLAQDVQYLNAYSRVLARASVLAPNEQEQRFWADAAQSSLAVEADLHLQWLAGRDVEMVQGPETKAYVDHLQAVAFKGSYGEIVAALLPCYWLYAAVGEALHADYLNYEGSHPYGDWLGSYADEAFADANRAAVKILDTAARRGSGAERELMRQAFNHSAQFEVDFFDAPRRKNTRK